MAVTRPLLSKEDKLDSALGELRIRWDCVRAPRSYFLKAGELPDEALVGAVGQGFAMHSVGLQQADLPLRHNL